MGIYVGRDGQVRMGINASQASIAPVCVDSDFVNGVTARNTVGGGLILAPGIESHDRLSEAQAISFDRACVAANSGQWIEAVIILKSAGLEVYKR